MRRVIVIVLLAVSGLASPLTARAAESEVRPAIAAHYAPGLMEEVAKNRDMPVVSCMVVSPWHDIGAWIYVSSQVNGQTRLCRVTDIGQPWDRPRHLKKRLIELDFGSAQALCEVRTVGDRPARACPVQLADAQPPRPWPAVEQE